MTDIRSARLLDAAVATLRDEILPQITDDVARIKVDHVTRLLWDVSARLSKREDGLRDFLGGASAALGTATAPDGADIEVLEQTRRDAEADICARLPELIADAVKGGGVKPLRDLLDVERRFYISQDPDVAAGSAVVYRGGRIEGRKHEVHAVFADVDEAGLTAYLRKRTGRDDVAATDVKQIPGGFSKETIFFTLTDAADGSSQNLVIRKDLPTPLIEKTVVDEFPLLTKIFATGFPVAEPLWLEADASLFDGAFIVSRRVAGTNDTARWAADPVRAKAACEQLARILAQLHAYDPAELGVGVDGPVVSAGVWVEREVDRWIRLFHKKRQEAFPLQEMPLVWLKDNIPAVLYDRPARIVHGDVGFHNLMFDDAGQVTALLDWEFSVLGDPTQDMCFVRQFVEGLMPWDDFLKIYFDAGGEPPCPEAEFYFRLWTATRNAVGCVDAQTLFDTTMPNEMRFALAGHIFAPYMFVDQCEMLIDHLAGRSS